ncbi:hypothetical protein [Oceanirhabdus sp. W0125-5]|uniref:hypothetical protein n=1 Tax=Oceanirhabdus sp. W0125-5 TaxID=2999116 RepID=UPI0022F2FABB|nr:hypothetical protein [Oceanirhabdus sp. W0125-5]WBW98144.1 hypothetical protein OW730_05090 [Oceanirhabdus sp. W0125-5]
MDKAITLHTDKQNSIDELSKKAMALLRYIKYYGKKKGWNYEIILVVSQHKSNFAIKYKELTSKKGRPKDKFYEPKRINCKTKPHIHIALINAQPCNTITKALNKYWKEREGIKKVHFKNIYYLEGYLEYIENQSTLLRKSKL